MTPSKETFSAAKKLADKKGYDRVVFDEAREECIIYNVGFKSDAGLTIGYPFFIIVDEKLNARFAGHEEVWGWD